MAYIELRFSLAAPSVETVSDTLLQWGAVSVSVEDEAAGSEQESPLFDEPGVERTQDVWQSNRVSALFCEQAEADRALLRLMQEKVLTDLHQVERAVIEEKDWVRDTQAQFGPFRVHEQLWIVPSWSTAPADCHTKDVITLQLDPGLAFGTGSHATTSMCLRWLLAHHPQLRGQSLLDYGCGSGILAILAQRLGAQPVVAVDLDANAVTATLDNARSNATPLQACHPDQLGGQRYDHIVANILANPLKLLAPVLARHGKPGGLVALSGILARQFDDLRQTYAPYCDLQIFESLDGWVCLHGRWK